MTLVDIEHCLARRRNSGHYIAQTDQPHCGQQNTAPLIKSLQSSSASNGSSMSVFREILQSINPKTDENERVVHEKLRPEKPNNRSLAHFQSSRKYKTEICRNFELKGVCQWGQNCCYAHGKAELRTKISANDFYKTKVCRNFLDQGFCAYGSRCQYFHFKDNEIYKELLDSMENKILTKMNETTPVHMDSILRKMDRRYSRLTVFDAILKVEDCDDSGHGSF
jgi:hypothetical protein